MTSLDIAALITFVGAATPLVLFTVFTRRLAAESGPFLDRDDRLWLAGIRVVLSAPLLAWVYIVGVHYL